MASRPIAAGDEREGRTPEIGDEGGGILNEAEMDYSDRQQDQANLAEIRDHQGNIYLVNLEMLASVGVDTEGEMVITEEQLNMILTMIGQREESAAPPPIKEEYEESSSSDQLTISIQPDGGVKLVAAGGHESFFSANQLAEVGIDTQNLTDDDIKRIVHLASAASGEVLYDEMQDRPDKRRKLDNGGIEERREGGTRMQTMQRNYQHTSPHSTASTSSGHVPGGIGNAARFRGMSNGGRRMPMQNGLIGESVKIQNSKGKIVTAVVRYSRPGNGTQTAAYKVQTPDGKFEWIQPDRIIDRVGSVPRVEQQRDYDHKGYTSEPPAAVHATGPSTSTAGPLLPRRILIPPSGVGGPRLIRQLPMTPGVHAPQGQQQQQQPNFCCPVCDKKVYQKEPAYIVIRLPACDSCTREKILIVDESSKGGGAEGGGEEGGTEGGPSAATSARPSMRSIATDTDDLPAESLEKTPSAPSSTAASPEEEPEEEEEEGEGEERRQSPPAAAATDAAEAGTAAESDEAEEAEEGREEEIEEKEETMAENQQPTLNQNPQLQPLPQIS